MAERFLDEMTAMDPDFGNTHCLNQVKVAGTKYFFLKYIILFQALTVPVMFCLRFKARLAAKAGTGEEASLRKKGYLATCALVIEMLIAAMFMETSAEEKLNGPFGGMPRVNTIYIWYILILGIFIAVKDFGRKVPLIGACFDAMPSWTWAIEFFEMIVLGIGGVWLPLMGTWTLYRCYDLVDSIGHLIPSGSYFVWSGVMMCFMGRATKTHAGKLRLLLAESYMWAGFGGFFIMYYNWQSGGGMFYTYIHPNQVNGLWIADQQHTMISLCWLTCALVSRVNVSLGYANSFHYLVIAPPVVMTMFDHPKACHRTEMAHKMHGLLLLGSLFFRAFDRIHQASVLMCIAGLSFISATQCMIVWSIGNQVVELFIFTVVGGGLMFWTYSVYIFKDLIFDPEDLNTDLTIAEMEKVHYSPLKNPAEEILDERENGMMLS